MTPEERFIYCIEKTAWYDKLRTTTDSRDMGMAWYWLTAKRYYAIIWADEWLKKRWGEERVIPIPTERVVPQNYPMWKFQKIEMAKLTEEELFEFVFAEPEKG